jgi:hypothetical protein
VERRSVLRARSFHFLPGICLILPAHSGNFLSNFHFFTKHTRSNDLLQVRSLNQSSPHSSASAACQDALKQTLYHHFIGLPSWADQYVRTVTFLKYSATSHTRGIFRNSRMASSGMLRRAALVRTDVSEELIASIIRVTRIGELGTTLAVTSKRRTLRRNTKCVGC